MTAPVANERERLMMKIIIGAAWADQELASTEVTALEHWLERLHGQRDPELITLLREPIPLAQTETWVLSYLQDATYEERLRLLGAIGNLIIADRSVSDLERKLLDDFHAMMAAIPPAPEPLFAEQLPTMIHKVGSAVKQFLRHKVHA
ncbi:MAG: hypothetical protein OHK0012_02520 [Synechococcales cyanobacterium]